MVVNPNGGFGGLRVVVQLASNSNHSVFLSKVFFPSAFLLVRVLADCAEHSGLLDLSRSGRHIPARPSSFAAIEKSACLEARSRFGLESIGHDSLISQSFRYTAASPIQDGTGIVGSVRTDPAYLDCQTVVQFPGYRLTRYRYAAQPVAVIDCKRPFVTVRWKVVPMVLGYIGIGITEFAWPDGEICSLSLSLPG